MRCAHGRSRGERLRMAGRAGEGERSDGAAGPCRAQAKVRTVQCRRDLGRRIGRDFRPVCVFALPEDLSNRTQPCRG